ncbi:MAG: hypothetical protein V1772_09670, partial [Chloroflexota bacterium]
MQIYITADDATLMQRFRARWEAGQRHPGHLDDLSLADLAANLCGHVYAPLNLDGVLLRVDTARPDAVDLAAIIRA